MKSIQFFLSYSAKFCANNNKLTWKECAKIPEIRIKEVLNVPSLPICL